MATGTWGDTRTAASANVDNPAIGQLLWRVLKAMGSLKITVAMFSLGIIILFVGTLAQDEEQLKDVKAKYFNSWIAPVDLDVFLPITIWPDHARLPLTIPIPGGATVGLVLLINLIAAKVTRFSMQATGGRFAAGLFFTALGSALLGLVVWTAHQADGLQGEPPFSYDSLWKLCLGLLWVLAAASLAAVLKWPSSTRLGRQVQWLTLIVLAGAGVFYAVTGDQYRINDPGLRIVWQLMKSLVVGLVFLAGFLLLFGKRGGNVLIHLGVALLMLGQFIFGDPQIEERISLYEGQAASVAYRIDECELAIIDSSGQKDRVVSIESRFLERAAGTEKPIEHPDLPVKLLVDRYYVNSALVDLKDLTEQLATAGNGLSIGAMEKPKSGGANSDVNIASAYVTVTPKAGGDSLGTFLVSQFLHDDELTPRVTSETLLVDGKPLQMQLRFAKSVKPYSLRLDDVQRIDYSGTMTPRDYSSFVTITDQQGEGRQQGRIWMNNPMRYQGETFYQSEYASAEQTKIAEKTTLQVVTNAGWLIPYVACVLSGLGMLVHFSGTFARFALRYDRVAGDVAESSASTVDPAKMVARWRSAARQASRGPVRWAIPLLALLLAGLWIGSKARKPSVEPRQFDWYSVGQIPMQHEGRVKPLDSVARNLLQAVSNKAEVRSSSGEKIPASRWLMGLMSEDAAMLRVPCIRIDAKEVLDALGLENREGHRYSYEEVAPGIGAIREELRSLDPENHAKWTFAQKKKAELSSRFGVMELVRFAYRPDLPQVPAGAQGEEAQEQFQRDFRQVFARVQMIEQANPPGIIPPAAPKEEAKGKVVSPERWQAFGPAIFTAFASRLMQMEADQTGVLAFADMVDALRADDARKFNDQVDKFKRWMAESNPEGVRMKKAGFEAWYNHLSPVNFSATLYVVIALVCLASFLIARHPLRRYAFWFCVAAFALHSFAIGARIYISERPPVVNLYSSAVFIGWSVVLAGLIIEALYPIGVSLLVGAVTGFLTLMVAYGLDTSDTMPVLQAVLDTQFWLATHVVSVTLGYGATFFAGALGIAWIAVGLWGLVGRKDAMREATLQATQKLLDRITYGVVCFAIFFSFIGTVLGGLWGDDSWGRFWGWDPKENGALMIVLWNAILLHARWDKLVTTRGFALLAVAGNIITAWSWFGTNQLGIGLHSYGFTNGILMLLGGFVLSQLGIILVGATLLGKPRVESA